MAWQQGLNQQFLQRLQQPLNRQNIGQVLVDRTDKFLTRFSLVEQQFERWGKFQESNPNALPIVFVKPTFAGKDSAQEQAIAQAPSIDSSGLSDHQNLVMQHGESRRPSGEAIAPSTTPLVSGQIQAKSSNPSVSSRPSDILIQRFVDPAASAPTTEFSPAPEGLEVAASKSRVTPESHASANISSPNDVVILEITPLDINAAQGIDLPLAQSNAVTSPTNPDIQESALSSVQPPEGLARENQAGDRPEILGTNSESQAVLKTTDLTDVPLVFALPNHAEQLSVISTTNIQSQSSTETVLPVVKTRLEQLLVPPRNTSKLPTVAPEHRVRRSPQQTETPLVKPLSQQSRTNPKALERSTQTAVQPQSMANTATAQNDSLPLTQTKIVQTDGRSPTPPNPSNPFSSSTQAPVPIVSPQIHAAANPVTETFQAAMAEATQQPPVDMQAVDIQAIANQVEKKLRKKMVIERERRGQGRWR